MCVCSLKYSGHIVLQTVLQMTAIIYELYAFSAVDSTYDEFENMIVGEGIFVSHLLVLILPSVPRRC